MSTPDSLSDEVRRLRAQLAELFQQAEHNDRALRRYRGFELQFISAGSFRELLDIVFHGFAESAGLHIVTMALLDPAYELRRILVELGVHSGAYPQLLFLQEQTELGELHDQLSRPVLGAYSEQLHGLVFPDPLPAPASVATLPLTRHGQLIGCLNLGSQDPARFTSQMATDFIEHMGRILAVCLENVINNERLKHMGLTDPLTGVNNRRYIESRLLEEAIRSQRHGNPLSCLYIDIDHFKQINDRIGHQAGDQALRAVAACIKTELRLSDALARFGGEEFLVLLTDTEERDALSVAQRIRSGVSETLLSLNDGEEISVTVSIGVSSLAPAAESESPERLVQLLVAGADRALYQAKEDGRNRVVTGACE